MVSYIYIYLSVHQDTKLLPFNKTIAVHINLLGGYQYNINSSIQHKLRNTNNKINLSDTKYKSRKVNKFTYKYKDKYKYKKCKKKGVFTSLMRSINLHTNTIKKKYKKYKKKVVFT